MCKLGATSAERFGFEDARVASPLAWDVPSGWEERSSGGAGRLVTFRLGARKATECFVTIFPGSLGGTASLLNRWRRQMGLPPLDEAAIARLPQVSLLGEGCPLLEVEGTYDPGGAPRPESYMLGTLLYLGEGTVFIKLVGPAAEARAERERFLSLVRSLRKA
jgi:hypothetical protein